MCKNPNSYSGGYLFGLLAVDNVTGIPKSIGMDERHSEPWIQELKLATDKWTDCAVYYSYNGPVFNNVKVVDEKDGIYLPHIYIWADLDPNRAFYINDVKMKVFSSEEMKTMMPQLPTTNTGRKRISFKDHPGDICTEVTDFARAYDPSDPQKTIAERTAAENAITAALNKAISRQKGVQHASNKR